MADHLETYEGAIEPIAPYRMGLSDWISLLHHYLNYNSLPMNQMTRNPVVTDSDYQRPDIGGRTLQNAGPPSNQGVWNLGQDNGFSLDRMPAIDRYNQIYNQNPNLSNWR